MFTVIQLVFVRPLNIIWSLHHDCVKVKTFFLALSGISDHYTHLSVVLTRHHVKPSNKLSTKQHCSCLNLYKDTGRRGCALCFHPNITSCAFFILLSSAGKGEKKEKVLYGYKNKSDQLTLCSRGHFVQAGFLSYLVHFCRIEIISMYLISFITFLYSLINAININNGVLSSNPIISNNIHLEFFLATLWSLL